MKRTLYAFIASVAVTAVVVSCASSSSIKVSDDVEKDFEVKKQMLTDQSPFAIFEDSALTGDRLTAMKFLYAYMPLPDIASHSPEFFLRNVDTSLKAREEMPWGKTVPDKEFLHFVLPIRANNEELDSSRWVFYEELKERVKGLSMEEAILEVNHWCHEKVSYQPSDARTSSPLSAISQAIGRCGEESTFTVAALRAVGIPARQVYTPRWAHTDDNHAWVEAWANGKWHFLGACEPEAVLDLGWFNSSASRGMLMSTNVFGRYDGPEEIIKETPLLTTINVTENYAKVKPVNVVVTSNDGKRLSGVKTNFSIYNYAEFYPVASKFTNENGETKLTTGLGDLVVWAANDGWFGFEKVNPLEKDTFTLVLDKPIGYQGSFTMEIVPPEAVNSLPVVEESLKEANQARLHQEDSIRLAYIATFVNEEQGNEIAVRLGLDPSKVANLLALSRGNHAVLVDFLEGVDAGNRDVAASLLGVISEKDLRDIDMEVLKDHFYNSVGTDKSDTYVRYVMNPRVENEALYPYRGYLQNAFTQSQRNEFAENPLSLVKWIKENITIDNELNPRSLKMNPIGVMKQRKADNGSRDIFFVAAARSAGIPARMDIVRGIPQYLTADKEWVDVKFDTDELPQAPKGSIAFKFQPTRFNNDLKYYSQFSVARLDDGYPVQLEFDENATSTEITASKPRLDEGDYLVLTGQRLANGTVLVNGHFFHIDEKSTKEVPLALNQDEGALQVIGSLNAETIFHNVDTDTDQSIISLTGRGYYVLGIIKPGDEPSTHVLKDLIASREEFDNLGNSIVLLFESDNDPQRFVYDDFKGLPSSVAFGVDKEGSVLAELVGGNLVTEGQYPIFVIADSFNRVVLVSQGYSIGLGDRIADSLKRLN